MVTGQGLSMTKEYNFGESLEDYTPELVVKNFQAMVNVICKEEKVKEENTLSIDDMILEYVDITWFWKKEFQCSESLWEQLPMDYKVSMVLHMGANNVMISDSDNVLWDAKRIINSVEGWNIYD